MLTIVSNTIIIPTSSGDYCITKAYLSANSTNNVLNLSFSVGPYTNGFYNAAISMFDGIKTTIDYVSLPGYPGSTRIGPNPNIGGSSYLYLMI